jgi:hypothetical protein
MAFRGVITAGNLILEICTWIEEHKECTAGCWVHEWIKRSASCMKYSAKKSHHQVYKCKCVMLLEGTSEVTTQRITKKSLKQ